MTIIKRADLGRPLTWDELDDNFQQVDELTAAASAAVSSAAASATAAAGSATNSLNSANSAAGSADDAAASATVAINALMNSTFEPADFDFTSGGTLSTTDRNKAVFNPSDNNWYSWTGTLPHEVAVGTDPTADSNWRPRTDQLLRQNLASSTPGAVEVNSNQLTNTISVPFTAYLAVAVDATAAITAAAASGVVVLFPEATYDIQSNDIPVARFTKFIGPNGGYVTFRVMSSAGTYGTFDMRTGNGLSGGRYNKFANIQFRYPNQVFNIDGVSVTAPIVYPPIFHGGAFESSFENLDIGNAYYGFRLGGELSGVDLGSCSRIRMDHIIGAPLYRGLSLEQVRDVSYINDLRWNYNYLDGGTYAYNATLKQWMHDNAWAFHFGRVDWCTVTNLFQYGYLRNIVSLSTRYTGSADRLKFIGCFADHTVYPVWLQNFTNRVDFIECGFTGDYNSEFTRIAPNQMYCPSIGDSNAEVVFASCTFNNFSGGVFAFGTRLTLDNCRVWGYGYDSTAAAPRNALLMTSATTVTVNRTEIDSSAGAYSRAAYDGGIDGGILVVTGGSRLVGATLEIFRWNGGTSSREMIAPDCTLSGSTSAINARGFISFYNPQKVYQGTSMPTTGTFTRGEYVKNTAYSVLGSPGSLYVIKGWSRITTGSSNVLNTDWVEDRSPTGA